MIQHQHGHLFRAQQEADRIIANFGRQPSASVKERLRATLSQEKEQFLALQAVRERARQPQRVQSKGRSR